MLKKGKKCTQQRGKGNTRKEGKEIEGEREKCKKMRYRVRIKIEDER